MMGKLSKRVRGVFDEGDVLFRSWGRDAKVDDGCRFRVQAAQYQSVMYEACTTTAG